LKIRRENVEVVLDKEDADVPSGGKLWMLVRLILEKCGCGWELMCLLESNWRMTLLTKGTSELKYKYASFMLDTHL
jgi:hypothetical protein